MSVCSCENGCVWCVGKPEDVKMEGVIDTMREEVLGTFAEAEEAAEELMLQIRECVEKMDVFKLRLSAQYGIDVWRGSDFLLVRLSDVKRLPRFQVVKKKLIVGEWCLLSASDPAIRAMLSMKDD